MLIDISKINKNAGRRLADTTKVEELAESIEQIGLINPITVAERNNQYLLVAGLHRLEAYKLLGKDKIEANVIKGTGLELELVEIDENLIRNELHYTELDGMLSRKKVIYEEMYPETKDGGDRGNQYTGGRRRIPSSAKTSYVKDTSDKIGKSETVIKESVYRDTYLIPEAKPILKEKDITKTEATILARKKPEVQKRIIDYIKLSSGDISINKAYQEIAKPHVAHNSGNNEWYTPIKLLDIARKVMGSIDTDPASSEIANRNVRAETYYTEQSNGLNQEWNGNVWMNPPYAQPLIQQFANKLIKEIEKGNTKQAMVLVNNATETKWFNTLSEKAAAIWFIKGRVKFIDSLGNSTGAPLQGQAVLYFGENIEAFFEHCEGLVCRCEYK